MPLFKRKTERTLKDDIEIVRETINISDRAELLNDLLFSWMPNYSRGLVNQKLQLIKKLRREDPTQERDLELETNIEDVLRDIEKNN